MKLNVKAFALSFSLIWGIGLFVLTWWVILFDGATGDPTIVGMVYRGYNISATGSFIGLIWGLADGFVGGLIFAWLYNCFAGKANKSAPAA
jgi:hypothetical protein